MLSPNLSQINVEEDGVFLDTYGDAVSAQFNGGYDGGGRVSITAYGESTAELLSVISLTAEQFDEIYRQIGELR